MNMFAEIARRIIQEQALVIGPLAWIEAGKVAGLRILEGNTLEITGDNQVVIDSLVGRYQNLFGDASREVSRVAVAQLLSQMAPEQVPLSLK